MEGASEFYGASLKGGPTSPLDFLPTVGQIGEEAAHFLPHCGTGSQAQISGCLLAHPTPNGAIGQKSGH